MYLFPSEMDKNGVTLDPFGGRCSSVVRLLCLLAVCALCPASLLLELQLCALCVRLRLRHDIRVTLIGRPVARPWGV